MDPHALGIAHPAGRLLRLRQLAIHRFLTGKNTPRTFAGLQIHLVSWLHYVY
jgi:hypothetical protein